MADDKKKDVWEVQVPSTADAQHYVEMQYYRGQITKRTRDEALKQLRSVKGVTYDSEAAAKRAAKNIKNARVVNTGYTEQSGCALWTMIGVLCLVVLVCLL